ncbi:MAG: ribonuclease H-like domain-containing protein [Planctomycetota bacterium]
MKTRAGRERRPVRPPDSTGPPALAELLGGQERRCGRRAVWQIETPFVQVCRRQQVELPPGVAALSHRRQPAPIGELNPERGLVIDIETGGFAGNEVFLVGFVPLDERPLRVVQYLVRDYPEEETLLRCIAELARQRDEWVSFNGKSFDEPFLLDRAARFHVALQRPTRHIDLLHVARRLWRDELPNCKLQTLEQHLLGWQRVGDVPGSDIPDLFHHFMRTGNARPVRPVLEHNQLDLISCTELLLRAEED